MTKTKILLTGGSGFIGSHTAVELLKEGTDVAIIDNLSNSSPEVLKRITKITKRSPVFFKIDLRDRENLEEVFKNNNFSSVIHFAGLKAVGESVREPLKYYDNNLTGTIVLLETMLKYKVNELVFSSSACVYGEPKKVPITENFEISPLNPYGQTKAMIELIIKDTANAYKDFKAIILRYFNPVGADKSGLIGEDPNGIPNNLVPFISQVAVGKLPQLKVFGNDYPTPDGTALRDYIHVVDLAKAHLKALQKLKESEGVKIYNLGTGKGSSVLEMITAFEKASGVKINFEFAPRRSGDATAVFTNPALANKELNWFAEKDIDEMCEDVWRWQKNNPDGFR